MTGPSFCNTARLMSRLQTSSPRDFRKEVHLPPFTIAGEFIEVIQTIFNFQLEGGFFPLGFPSFPHLFCFEHCFSFSIVQGDLWP